MDEECEILLDDECPIFLDERSQIVWIKGHVVAH